MKQNEHYHPEYVTQKTMCAILGVCKSTAYAIQRHGLIPFEYENTPDGRRQRIAMADILDFQDRQKCFGEPESDFVNILRQYFVKRLKQYPPVLTVSDMTRFTGYAKTTINNWIASDELASLRYKGQRIKSLVYGRGSLVTKESFVDFLVSPHYRNIKRKSTLHKEQAQEYTPLFMSLRQQGGVANV